MCFIALNGLRLDLRVDVSTDTSLSIQKYSDTNHQALARVWYESWVSTGLAATGQATVHDLLARVPEELRNGWVVYVARDGKNLVGFLALKPAEGRTHSVTAACSPA